MADFDLDLDDINPVFDLVVFRYVNDIKLTNPIVHVTYDLGHDFDPSTRDWIGLFYTGWNTVNEYLAFKWAPIFPQSMNTIHRRRRSIMFHSTEIKDLKDETAYFQFLYIARGDHVIGVSNPFKFCIQPGYEDDLHFDTLENWAMSPPFILVGEEQNRKRCIDDTFDFVNEFDTYEPVKKKWPKKKTVIQDTETLLNIPGIKWDKIFQLARTWSEEKNVESISGVVVPYKPMIKPIYDINESPIFVMAVQEDPSRCLGTGLPSLPYEQRLALMPGPQSVMIKLDESSKKCDTCAMGKILFKEYVKHHTEDQEKLIALQDENKRLREELEDCKFQLKQHCPAESFRVAKQNLKQLEQIIAQNRDLEDKLRTMEEWITGLMKEKDRKDIKNKSKTDEEKQDDEILRLLKEGFRGVLDVNGQQIEVAEVQSTATDENSWKVKFPKRIERMRTVIDQQNTLISRLTDTVASQNEFGSRQSHQIYHLKKELNLKQSKIVDSERKVCEMTSRIRGILRERAKEMTNEWRQFARNAGSFQSSNNYGSAAAALQFCNNTSKTTQYSANLHIRSPASLRFNKRKDRVCPTCHMVFGPHVDDHVVEEHIVFHTRYNKKFN